MWGLCIAYGGDQTAQAIALLCGASPGAAASYILARQMGGDAPLMAGVVALTTVGSAMSIPILLTLFHLRLDWPYSRASMTEARRRHDLISERLIPFPQPHFLSAGDLNPRDRAGAAGSRRRLRRLQPAIVQGAGPDARPHGREPVLRELDPDLRPRSRSPPSGWGPMS